MAYLVFARKWRPLSFEDVVGQEHITETLKKAIETDRVAHAYIFTGTRGVGKTTTARILARALNCDKGPTTNPCGECNSCKNILGGSSFDVLEIDGASNNKVEDVRDLRDNIGYSSMGGKYRIFVIDEVHMLSNSAFNALLKTLEEPPEKVIFIFATTEPHKIPATIHSRCQRYDFRRIGAEQILARLIHICDSEKIPYERSALMLVARKAEGSMRDSMSLLDQVYSFCKEAITEKEVRSVLGLVGTEVYREVMNNIKEKNPVPALKAVQDVLYNGFDLHEFITGFQDHIRNLLFARISGALESRGIELENDIIEQLRAESQNFAETDLLRMAEILKKTESELKWSAFPRFLVEVMMLKLVYLDSTLNIEQLLQLASGGGSSPGDAVENTASILSAETEAKKKKELKNEQPSEALITPVEESCDTIPLVSSPKMPVDLNQNWPLFLDTFMNERPELGAHLSHGQLVSVKEEVVELEFGYNYRFQYQKLTQKNNKEEISKYIKTFTGQPLEVRITLDTSKKDTQVDKPPMQFTPSRPVVSIDDDIEKEPIIQTLIDMLDGEVLS
ncbi:DNA polymerase III subunit gamma/tau [Chitinispirillales bacterium ANBcel5]|uniref:DNA polymerase III subunit gamma/tau n=1 Tax=Cellulosispirillum alkaliphilum TaxID=3039283 RepID=UPI002A4E53ED|nr:DNA polymerase III subunit gamma/tau [Chitinispirillales bacterium ANBcel5]